MVDGISCSSGVTSSEASICSSCIWAGTRRRAGLRRRRAGVSSFFSSLSLSESRQGDIRDFPGNYSDYRDWREAKEQREKEAEKPKEEKTARVRLNDKRKMSFKEKKEFEQLEQEIAGLEQEKADIEAALCSGTLGVEELTEKSKRLPELNDLIDEKTMRWLELSEIEG